MKTFFATIFICCVAVALSFTSVAHGNSDYYMPSQTTEEGTSARINKVSDVSEVIEKVEHLFDKGAQFLHSINADQELKDAPERINTDQMYQLKDEAENKIKPLLSKARDKETLNTIWGASKKVLQASVLFLNIVTDVLALVIGFFINIIDIVMS